MAVCSLGLHQLAVLQWNSAASFVKVSEIGISNINDIVVEQPVIVFFRWRLSHLIWKGFCFCCDFLSSTSEPRKKLDAANFFVNAE